MLKEKEKEKESEKEKEKENEKEKEKHPKKSEKRNVPEDNCHWSQRDHDALDRMLVGKYGKTRWVAGVAQYSDVELWQQIGQFARGALGRTPAATYAGFITRREEKRAAGDPLTKISDLTVTINDACKLQIKSRNLVGDLKGAKLRTPDKPTEESVPHHLCVSCMERGRDCTHGRAVGLFKRCNERGCSGEKIAVWWRKGETIKDLVAACVADVTSRQQVRSIGRVIEITGTSHVERVPAAHLPASCGTSDIVGNSKGARKTLASQAVQFASALNFDVRLDDMILHKGLLYEVTLVKNQLRAPPLYSGATDTPFGLPVHGTESMTRLNRLRDRWPLEWFSLAAGSWLHEPQLARPPLLLRSSDHL